MPKTSVQRIKVWRGQLERTTGGLTKAMLTKNKRGKIVSKTKSRQAASSNNLGNWLHDSGVAIPKAKILRYKSSPPEGAKQAKEKPAGNVVKAPKPEKKVAKAPKKVAKAPKKVAKPVKQPAAKQPAAKPVAKVAKPKPKPKKAKKAKPKVNPITGEAYKKKSGLGYAGGSAIDLDNIMEDEPEWDLSMF